MPRARQFLLATITSSLVALAGSAGATPSPHLVQVPLASQQKSAQAAPAAGPRQGRPGGLNQQVRPASSRDKFRAEPGRQGEDVYIVRLHDLPVSTYDGRVKGLAATTRSAGTVATKAAQSAYRKYLKDRQHEVLQLARGKRIDAPVRRQFTDAVNAFTLELTQAEAAKFAAMPQVAYVQRSRLREMLTDRGPTFVRASNVWSGEAASGVPYKGEGLVVGILDSGVNTDHPSFAAVGGDGYVHVNPRGAGNYLGDCATGGATCNDKLIGVWSWPFITDTYNGVRPASGEDYNGHGSHTASTAAGNVVLDAPLVGGSLGDGDGSPTGFTFDSVSGVAPHANIISYQGCFPNGGCPDEATLAGIEQAIADGVDVINFSIGGSDEFPWQDAVALAFLSARESGISVAASAGNAGTGFFTLSHTAPWYLIVAASTHDRALDIPQKTFALTGGATPPPEFPTFDFTEYGGISVQGITGTLVNAATRGDELCSTPFPAGTFAATEIAVCKRGGIARVTKAANVLAGGAGGFILVNAGYPDDDDGLVNDVYPLPGIQLHSYDGQAMLAWMADGGTGHTATISPTVITSTIDPALGDQLAEFSSRGPANTFTGSLAPGISAPGVDIFAAWADEHPFNPDSALSRDWAVIGGTSMASPHVAGAMALVRQAHPDWTASEVQSALQMTASETVSYRDFTFAPLRPAGIYRAGAGRLDVLAATNSGLVMDESASDFEFANPRNGGDVLQLNLPQLVNNNCRDVCSWIRTVRATRDGTWSVSHGPWTFDRWTSGEGEFPQNGIELDAFPSTFTLRAGESKTILFRADLTDAQFRRNGFDHVNTSEEIELWGKVIFTPSDPAIPAARWPVSMNFDHGTLPKTLELGAYRSQGGYRVKDVGMPALATTQYRAYGLALPTVETLVLPQDIDHVPPQFDGDFSYGNTVTRLVNVPAGTARFVVENLKNVATTADLQYKRGWATVYIGLDSNGNGLPDFDAETLCSSNTEVELNYCSITRPDAGSYWVFINNVRGGLSDGDPEQVIDTYRIATALVPETATTNFTITGPASTTGAPVALDLNWTLPTMGTGDVAYGAFDVGAGNAPGSVGFVPVKITRGVDDLSMTVSQTRARPGEILDVAVHVRENLTGADRVIDLNSTLPAGLAIVPGSVKVNTPEQRGNLTVNGSTIRVAGTQLDSEDWQADYVVTTSATSPVCRTPIYSANGQSSNGHFVGLYRNLFLRPDFGGHADFFASDAATIALSNFWGPGAGYALYNNGSFQSYPELLVSPQGWVIQEPFFGDTMFVHHAFPYLTFPYTPMIGVLWKGTPVGPGFFGPSAINALATPLNVSFDPAQTSGMLVAYDPTRNDLLVEWVGARTEHTDFNTGVTTVLDDRYDMDLIINRDHRFGEGQFEILMAYDNIDYGTQPGEGTIGLQGYAGPLTSFGPLNGDLAVGYAYNDLQSKIADDLVVCYDYVGPESTQFDVTFKVRVAETAAGSDQLVRFNSHVAGLASRSVEATITVPGSFTMGAIGDQTTPVDTLLAGLPIIYVDNDGTPNTVTVTGEHVTATVHGHTPGSTFDLMPEAGFEGVTSITVTVADQTNPGDRASTTFFLTVGTPVPPGGDTIFSHGFE